MSSPVTEVSKHQLMNAMTEEESTLGVNLDSQTPNFF